MNKDKFMKILKKRRIYLFIIGIIVIGIIPIPLKGVQFGMDFKGGTLMDLRLDEEASTSQMNSIVNILGKRVNTYGLKDVSITPQENQFIRVEVAETDPAAVDKIRSIIGEQGSFETLYNGEVVLEGSQIEGVISNPQEGYGATPVQGGKGGYRWRVPFELSSTGAQEFADAVEGECTQVPGRDQCKELLYVFIDRPENALIIMNNSLYQKENSISPKLSKDEEQDVIRDKIPIEKIVKNSGAEMQITDKITSSILNKTENKTVIVPEGMYTEEELNRITNAQEIKKVPKTEGYWIVNALNLETTLHLTEGVTSGNAVANPSITGFSKSEAGAFEEITRMKVLLKEGKLPIGVQIERVSRVSPALGKEFLNYSLIAGLVAILSVAAAISIRYRRIKVIAPLLTTSFSEVLMTIGAAAWIGWQIDLPAIAGIIAVVGTGVDHQIIMTDEALSEDTDKRKSLAKRVKRAFSIIMRASTTTIFAMFPLLFMGLGTLQGFAIVTILGTLIGVLISRPAYRAIINEIL